MASEGEIERRFNIANYDSGADLKDLIRTELSKLLPDRYSVGAAAVNDQDGRRAGDHEVLIRSWLWTPEVKLGATPEPSRSSHYPIESIYSAIEIKQTIGYSEKAFYQLFIHTLGHLTRSVLQVHDLHRHYGDLKPVSDFIQWGNARFNYERGTDAQVAGTKSG